MAIGADIAAFQEVGNTAARRVFPAPHWHVEMSSRPIQEPGRACWDRPEARFGHVATGLAIHRGVAYRRNDDLKSLREGDAFQGWATDITVTGGGRDLRLLPVHLKTGCWGAGEDRDERREETCAVLHGQMTHLKDWADARRAEGTAFVVLGDFNRRLAVPGDWAWGLLSSPSAPLHLAASSLITRCDPRFTELIGHLVLGGGAESMLVANSIRELPRHGPHPDHYAMPAAFTSGGGSGGTGAPLSGD